MKILKMHYSLLIVFLLSSSSLFSQVSTTVNFQTLAEITVEEEYENVFVKKIFTDEYSSTFVIWVKNEVKAHLHENHTEQIYVVSGTAEMIIGEEQQLIEGGQWIVIPENAVHSVKVTSKEPLKVVSIQTPEFFGKDRIWQDK